MNSHKISDIITPFLVTLAVLLFFEVFSSSVLPALGFSNYRISMHILIILYLAFKVNAPYTAILILLIEIFHGAFAIEGWALGTFTGVLVAILVSYLKDLIQLTSILATIVITQIFQTVWFVIEHSVLYLKIQDTNYLAERFWSFIPESIILSICAPALFLFLDKWWKLDKGRSMSGVN